LFLQYHIQIIILINKIIKMILLIASQIKFSKIKKCKQIIITSIRLEIILLSREVKKIIRKLIIFSIKLLLIIKKN
jgi:hypothetical protein